MAFTHVLFDFFGTLVAYSPSRTAQGYARSHALLREAGCALGYDAFLTLWSEVSEAMEAEAERTHREFSMQELGDAFFARALARAPAPIVDAFVATYVDEWNRGVRDLDGVTALLGRLAARFTLAVVSNTNDRELVPRHLERMGVRALFARVVTSVELGVRKPAPAIFAHAVRELGTAPERCVYVGDTYGADYRGATGAGIRAFLIDPRATAPIPEEHRLASLLALEERIHVLSPRRDGRHRGAPGIRRAVRTAAAVGPDQDDLPLPALPDGALGRSARPRRARDGLRRHARRQRLARARRPHLDAQRAALDPDPRGHVPPRNAAARHGRAAARREGARGVTPDTGRVPKRLLGTRHQPVTRRRWRQPPR